MQTICYTQQTPPPDMVDRIREALGIADPANNRWREIYPCAWLVAFLKLSPLSRHKLDYSTDWIDIADLLLQE